MKGRALLVGVLTAALLFVLWTWAVMVLIGALWSEFDFWRPVSFWEAALVVASITMLRQLAQGFQVDIK